MSERIRVLHIIYSFASGGAERFVLDLMQAMDKEKFEVAAVSLRPDLGRPFEKEIREKKLKVYFLNKRRGLDPRVFFRLYGVFKKYAPHVVHTHLHVLRYTLLPTILCGIPVRIHTVHDIAQRDAPIAKLFNSIAFRFGNVVPVSISNAVADTVREVYGQNLYTPVIYNGLPTDRFLQHSNKPKENSKQNIVLMNIARFWPQKNHKLLIEGFSIAVKEYSNMELWLVGDGPLRPEVEKIVKEKGLSQKVTFLGIQSNIAELLSESDIFVLTSSWEAFGLVNVEAMALRKPVIATAVGGIPEIVEDGKTGILVPANDPKALAQAIVKLAKNPALRESMGEEGQSRAVEYFDIKQTARQYEELYLRLLNGLRIQ